MRFNKTNYPMLELLRWHERLAACPTAKKIIGRGEKAREVANVFDYQWPRLVHLFAKRIDIVSTPFYKAAEENAPKICTPENNIKLFDDGPFSGTQICGKYVLFYSFDVREENNETALLCFYGDLLVLALLNTKKVFYTDPRQEGVPLEDYKRLMSEIQYAPIICALFKKYAEVETVEAKMGKKVEIQDSKEKLLWEFDMPATYIDCSWFREIVRREGFMVRGHFRLQPFKKNGEWTKKLIYIEPFQKHGYTRRAKIDLTKTD